MVTTTAAVLFSLLSLAAGLVAGALLWRAFGPHEDRNRDLERRLEDAEQRFGDYQTQVTEHFVETSRRVNELTRNYRDVHEYLASSAVRLSNPAVGQDLREAARLDDQSGSAETPVASDYTTGASGDTTGPQMPDQSRPREGK
ncbi:YhcB family protein [Gilvimarinus sp. F26214L]|uniref:YhcB family protein n=1 Tax=Gilvimarinus sp. DZF01 TaxID=3461371 RepID=UPI00404646E4